MKAIKYLCSLMAGLCLATALKTPVEARKARPVRAGQKYAVFLNGLGELWHDMNLRDAYRTLQAAGYRPKNIFVLDDRTRPNATYSVYAEASRGSLEQLLKKLSRKLSKKDTLFFYATGHGKKEVSSTSRRFVGGKMIFQQKIEAALFVRGGLSIFEGDLERYLKDMEAPLKIFFFDPCHSGGFARRLGKMPNSVAVSSTTADGTSFGSTYPEGFFKGLRGPADKNKDGRISVMEAFDYANRFDELGIQLGLNKPQTYNTTDPDKAYIK